VIFACHLFLKRSLFEKQSYTWLPIYRMGRHDRDRMVVGFTTTYAISAYYHWCRSGRGVQHDVILCVSHLRQVGGFFPGPPVSSTNTTNSHDINEILLKVALNTIKQTNKQTHKQYILRRNPHSVLYTIFVDQIPSLVINIFAMHVIWLYDKYWYRSLSLQGTS
jgi:hypothetical protein